VDLQGNYIDSIALTIEDFESGVIYEDEWATKLNLSLVISGRPLFPNELDVAVVGNLGGIGGFRQRFDKDVFYRREWISLDHPRISD
jgi:hypothetical protein